MGLLLLLPRQRRIRMLLLVSLRLLLLTLRSGVLVTPRYSSELVFWVSWKRFVKTGLVKFCLGFKLKPEERPPDWSLRKCKTKSLRCTVSKGPSGTTTLVRPGFCGNYGWLLSLISSVPSLPNTRQSMKKRLLLLKPTLTKLYLNVTRSKLSMKGLAM